MDYRVSFRGSYRECQAEYDTMFQISFRDASMMPRWHTPILKATLPGGGPGDYDGRLLAAIDIR